MDKKARELETRVRLDNIFAEAERGSEAPKKSRRLEPVGRQVSKSAPKQTDQPAAAPQEAVEAPKQQPRDKDTKVNPQILKYVMIAGLGVVFAGLLLFGVFMWKEVQNLKQLSGQSVATSQDSSDLVGDVGKIFLLPAGEPMIMNVDDETKLSEQEFFKNVKTGDKVLLYGLDGQQNVYYAVIFRVGEQKIINAGQIEMNSIGSGLQSQ